MDDDGQPQPHIPNGAGLSVLAHIDAQASRSAAVLAQLTGLPASIVNQQLVRLTNQGYLENTGNHRYRLARQVLGNPEIVVTSICHSRTTSKRRGDLPNDHGAAGATA